MRTRSARQLLRLLLAAALAQPGSWGCVAPPSSIADSAPAAPDRGPQVIDVAPAPPADAGTADAAAPAARGTYVVVAADALHAAAEEYAAYRASQGFATEVHRVSELVSGAVTAQDLVAAVHGLLAPAVHDDARVFLLLLGDAPASVPAPPGEIPAAACENLLGGCATDNSYGDLDGDGIPEIAVGRVPAPTLARARAYLAKLRAHEAAYEPGLWNRRVVVYAGEGGFGAEIDAMLEQGVWEGLKRLSHTFDTLGAYNNPRSAYYYTPFADKVVELLNEGTVLGTYVGHGLTDYMEGLTLADLPRLDCAHRLPIVVFLACWTGQFVGPDESIGEAVLWLERGPVAAVGATDISHPYPNGVLLYENNRALLNDAPSTVGEALLRAKRAMMENRDDYRLILAAFAASGGVPAAEQQLLRRQHLDLYNLLGDPATATQLPRSEVRFEPLGGSVAARRLQVSGQAPGIASGEARVTFEVERDVLLAPLQAVDPDAPDVAAVQANWEQAVDKVVVAATVPVQDEAFTAELAWTRELPAGPYYVKVYAQGGGADSAGFVKLP